MKRILLPLVVSIVYMGTALGAESDQPAASGQWQTLSVQAADQPAGGGQKALCEMRVPAAWKMTDKGATSGDQYGGTLVLEAEKPETWWNKRRSVDFKESRTFLNSRTNYWIEVIGALMSDSEEGTTQIIGVRDGNLVCHALLEFKSANWPDKYRDIVREMGLSIKPVH
jgi:hypothetical protein